MSYAIQLKNIIFGYDKDQMVLNDLSFNIEKGKYVSIIGHNGSGKSTIAKLIIGLLEAKSGEVWIDNEKLSIDNLYNLTSKVGIVFQNPDNQFIGTTVRDDIAFGLENHCVDPSLMEDIIIEHAKKVSMENFLESEPIKLSGGQKQRVAVAGILAMKPSIIILDEATSMLDPKGKKEINELVRDLNKNHNITVISITHDIEEAALSDEVILLNKGKVIMQDKPEIIFNNQELLISYGLDVPIATKISKALDLDIEIDTEKLVDKLWQLSLKK